MEAKLQAIYEAAEVVTKKMYPTLEDLDPKKLDELVHRITKDLKTQWLDKVNPYVAFTLRYWVGGSSENFESEYFVVTKAGYPFDCVFDYMDEACKRVSAVLSGHRFGLSVDVRVDEERIALEWRVVLVV